MTPAELAALWRDPGLCGADVLYWPCGYCQAPAGQPCRTLAGQPVGVARSHADRAESVRLWRRYGIGAAVTR